MGRNTALLQEIVGVLDTELDDPGHAFDCLESHFHTRLLVDAGNVASVGSYAEQLRLQITDDERSAVLDHIAEQKMVMVTVDHTEMAINELFEDRFIEP